MSTIESVGEFDFGSNNIKADRTGKFTLKLTNGGEWIFDLGEINRFDSILEEFETLKTGSHERSFWRTNGTKIIQILVKDEFFRYIFIIEGGKKKRIFFVQ